MSKPGKVLKALCKKLGVRLTVKRGKKRVYKSVKVLKGQCKRKAGKKKRRRRKFGSSSKKRKLYIKNSLKRKRESLTKDDFSDLLKRKRGKDDSPDPPILKRSTGWDVVLERKQSTGNDKLDDKFWKTRPHLHTDDYSKVTLIPAMVAPTDLKRSYNWKPVGGDYDYGVGDEFSQPERQEFFMTEAEKEKKARKEGQKKHLAFIEEWEIQEGFKFGKKKKVSRKKGPSAALKKLCKKLKVRLTTKRGKKKVYKSIKILKKQCKNAMKRKK